MLCRGVLIRKKWGADMRIVQVLHSHGFGGAENHALLLMQGLQERGHDVVFAGPRNSWLADQCLAHGIEIFHLRMAGMFDFWSHFRLHRFVQRWKADIVHGHLLRGAKYAAAAAGKAIPICTAHATTARKHMGGCRHIIAVADAVRDNLLSAGYSQEKISLIYNGVTDVKLVVRAEIRKALGIPDDVIALFNAGRFIRDKGQDLLVSAVLRIPGVHLFLAGDETTSFGKEVQAQADGDERITFLGYRPDVQRLLPAFDMYIMSSRREAFSLSLIEAYASGLATVATSVGGTPELIEHEADGLLVPPEDVEALASAIVRLVDDKVLRERLGQQARCKFLENFTAAGMVANIESLYHRLVLG